MSDESFYGVTLSAAAKQVEWEVIVDEEANPPQGQKLIIKQILLGAEAKEGEFNVIEAQTVKDNLKIPIAVLKAGETRALNPNIEFYETSVAFKLTKGNGPVYIHGVVIKDSVEYVDWDGDEEDDGEEEEEEDADEPQIKKKPRIENNSDGKNAKHKKK